MRAVGIPWQRWRSDWQACDCFGLVVLFYREVLGVELGDVPRVELATGFSTFGARWAECGPEAHAACFMAWRHGAPFHCGVMLDANQVLHAEGSMGRGGAVRITSLSVMHRAYGEIRFCRYEPC